MMSEETRRQILEMSVGVLLHNLLLAVVCLFWFREFSVFLGILAGGVGAEILLVSMAYSTELCVAVGDENYAKRKMILHALARSFSVLAAAALLWKFTEINILAAVLGTLGLKSGAYLYPVVHKFLNQPAGKSEA